MRTLLLLLALGALTAATTGCDGAEPPCGALPPVISPASVVLPPHDSVGIELSTVVGRFPAGTHMTVTGLEGAFEAEASVAHDATTTMRTSLRATTAYPGFHLTAHVHVEACSGTADLPLEIRTLPARGGANAAFGGDGAAFLDLGDADQQVSTLAIDKAGRLLVGGVVGDTFETRDFVVMRLLPDGTSDPTFETTRVDLGGEEFLDTMQVLDDGRIVAAGSSYGYTSGVESFALVRLLPDGGLDSSFGSGGEVVLDLGGGSQQVHGVLPGPDGSLLAIGLATAIYDSGIALFRLTASGDLDPSFGDGAGYRYVRPPPGTMIGGYGVGMVVQPPGRGNRVVVLAQGGDVSLFGLQLDGTIDPTFGQNGWAAASAVIGQSPQNASIAVAPDGSIWVAAEESGLVLGHFLADGSVDTSISPSGFVQTGHYGFYVDDRVALGVRADGRVLVAGAVLEGDEAVDLYEFMPDATLDPSFGTTPQFPGEVFTMFNGGSSYGRTLIISADGTFYVGGNFVANGYKDFLLLSYLQ